MTLFRKHIGFVRLVVGVAASTFLSACMTWQAQSLQPERFDSAQAVRLTLTTGDTLIVRNAVIDRDSLVGMQTRPSAPDAPYHRVSIPLTAIGQAEVQKGDPGARAAWLFVGLAGAAAIYAASNPCYAFCSGH